MIELNLEKKYISEDPFLHLIFKDVLNFSFDEFLDEFDKLPESINDFKSNKDFQKIEYKKSDGLLGELLEIMSSKYLCDICSDFFKLENLIPDPDFDGGGLTITPEGGYLRYHADFPYSEAMRKYRVLNAILYLSHPDIEGGRLHLLDYQSGTVEKEVLPAFGTLLIFPTTKYTYHGFSKILKHNRVTINSYFYLNQPLDDRFQPSKTQWVNF